MKMDDKQELEYLKKWYMKENKQDVFNYILTLASIVTALTSILAVMKSYDLGLNSPILVIIGIFLCICVFLLIFVFLGNFLGMKRS